MNGIVIMAMMARLADAPRDVDLIELNHVVAADGSVKLSQVILWDWEPGYDRFDVVEWRLASDGLPSRVDGLWRIPWRIDDGSVVVVRAKIYRETWTRYDPERDNVTVRPVSTRRRVR